LGYFRNGIIFGSDNETAVGYYRNSGMVLGRDNHTLVGYYGGMALGGPGAAALLLLLT